MAAEPSASHRLTRPQHKPLWAGWASMCCVLFSLTMLASCTVAPDVPMTATTTAKSVTAAQPAPPAARNQVKPTRPAVDQDKVSDTRRADAETATEPLMPRKVQEDPLAPARTVDVMPRGGARHAIPDAAQHMTDAAARPPDPQGLVRVGLLLPLSGPSASLGEALRNAAMLSLFDLADPNFVLQFYDTKGTPDGATEAAATALAHGVDMILGPLFGHSVRAIAPQARANGVPVVAFSTDTSVAGDGVYVMGFLLRQQTRRITAFAVARNHPRIAVLAPATPAGQTVAQDMQRDAPSLGGLVTDVVFYDPASDASEEVKVLARYDTRRRALDVQRRRLEGREDDVGRAALKRLEDLDTLGGLPFDAVLIAERGASLRSVASLLAFYDVDPRRVKFLGTMLWDEQQLSDEPSLRGGWYPAPAQDRHAQFVAHYRETFGSAPPRLASLAYDAAAMAAVISRGIGSEGLTREALTNPRGFAGVDGLFRLLPDGTSERGLAIMEIRPDGIREIDPAPATFNHPFF